MRDELTLQLAEIFEHDSLDYWQKLIETNEYLNEEVLEKIYKIMNDFDYSGKGYVIAVEVLKQIREGFEHGLSTKNVFFYARKPFNYYQMQQIRIGFENKLTYLQINIYANSKFDSSQMEQIRLGFEKGLTVEEVSIYAKPELNNEQMKCIREGFESGLNINQVKIYAKPEFGYFQMLEICRGFWFSKLTIEQVLMYAKPEYNRAQMEQIRLGLENGISFDQIKTYLNDGNSREKIDAMDNSRKKIVREMKNKQLINLLKHIN